VSERGDREEPVVSERGDSDRRDDAEITTEPPDPLAGSDDSVAKTGERLQEAADERRNEDDDQES
jgi:hypothetical protein